MPHKIIYPAIFYDDINFIATFYGYLHPCSPCSMSIIHDLIQLLMMYTCNNCYARPVCTVAKAKEVVDVMYGELTHRCIKITVGLSQGSWLASYLSLALASLIQILSRGHNCKIIRMILVISGQERPGYKATQRYFKRKEGPAGIAGKCGEFAH